MRAIALFGICSFLFFLAPTAGAQYAPNTVIVRFSPGVVTEAPQSTSGAIEDFSFAPGAVQEALIAVGAVAMEPLLPDFEGVNTTAVNGDPITLPFDMSHVYVVTLGQPNVPEAIDILSATTPDVVYAEPDYIAEAQFEPSDEKFDQQWWLKNIGQITGTPVNLDIGATDAWNTTTGYIPQGQYDRTIIGVLDSGIDFDHSFNAETGGELRVIPGPTFTGSANSDDNHPGSHGTAVGGIIAGIGNNGSHGAGLDWETNLSSIKVIRANNLTSASLVSKGIEYARQVGIPIINMSLGGTGLIESYYETVKNAHASGVLMVAAMGNTGDDVPLYPAALQGMVLAVGAVYADGERWEDSRINSTYGCAYNPEMSSSYGEWIDLVAPGGRSIATTKRVELGGFFEVGDPCDAGFSGTSAAVPVVSGVASLVRSVFGGPDNPLTGEDLEQILIRSARDVESEGEGFDIYTGWGVVDARAAVEFVSGGRVLEQGLSEGVGSTFARNRMMTFHNVAGLEGGREYYVQEWEFRNHVLFNTPFVEPPDAWGKSLRSRGWSNANPHIERELPASFCEVIPGSITSSGMLLRTYFYQVFEDQGHVEFVGWFPADPTDNYPEEIRMDWTAFGTPVTTSADSERGVSTIIAHALPNPARRTTTIQFMLEREVEVSLAIFSVNGKLIRRLANGLLPAGLHEFAWNTSNANGKPVAPGVYMSRLEAGGSVHSNKIVVVR